MKIHTEALIVLFGFAAWLCGCLSGWALDDILLSRESKFNFVAAIVLLNITFVSGWILYLRIAKNTLTKP